MKKMRRIAGLVLAMMMVLAMSISVFAAGETKTLTIKTAAQHSYEIYQLLIGDVSSLTDESGTLANVSAGLNLDGTVDAFDAAIKGTDGNYLSGTALSAAASAKITGTPVATIDGDGTDKKQDVVSGYYIVKDVYTDSGVTCAAYMVAVVGDTTMEPKTSTPGIDKNITDTDGNKALETGDSKKTDTAAIGDVINYESTSTVPVTTGYKYYYYVVNDTMSAGLTYNKDLVIKIGTGDSAVTLIKNTDYTITETNAGFELVVKDMKDISETKGLAGQAITITYSATVNENAKIGTEPNTNTVKLTYSNNPSDTFNKDKNTDNKPGDDDVVGVTPDHVTKTYVTELTLQKTDATSGIFEAALQGAEFTLTGNGLNDVVLTTTTAFTADAAGTYYKLKDGTYTTTAPVAATVAKYEDAVDGAYTMYKRTTSTTVTSTRDDDSSAVTTDTSKITAVVDPTTGTIKFTGLNAGSYKLEETKVPTGYNKCDDIKFTISVIQTGASNLVGGAITWYSDNAKIHEANGVFDTTIANQKGNTLPSTGGIGTTIFYLLGAILVLGAGVVLIARKRVNA